VDLCGDQRRDGHQAAVSGRKLRTSPDLAEQDIVGELDQLRGEVADQLLGGRGLVLVGGVVAGPSGLSDESAQGGAVDDRAAALAAHLTKLVLEAGPDAAEVDRGHLVERRDVLVGQVSGRAGDAGVVEGQVEPAELGHGPVDHGRHLCFVGDVAQHPDRPVAAVGQCLCGSGERGLVDVGEDDGRAGLGERLRGGSPMPDLAPVTRATWPLKSYVGFMPGPRCCG
jgi:hypothetical protein